MHKLWPYNVCAFVEILLKKLTVSVLEQVILKIFGGDGKKVRERGRERYRKI